jgi:hypothetical protein
MATELGFAFVKLDKNWYNYSKQVERWSTLERLRLRDYGGRGDE